MPENGLVQVTTTLITVVRVNGQEVIRTVKTTTLAGPIGPTGGTPRPFEEIINIIDSESNSGDEIGMGI